MRLLLEHPHVARIDCEDCKKFSYNLETGERREHNGDPIPVRKPPCEDDDTACPKVKPGHSDLNDMSIKIYRHYRYCKSCGIEPDDIFVRRLHILLDRLMDNIRASLVRGKKKPDSDLPVFRVGGPEDQPRRPRRR